MKILTLNLCATWKAPRKDRLRAVAEFIRQEGVDFLLCQEAVTGLVVRNSLKILEDYLPGDKFFSRPAFGFWGVYTFNVGIMGRVFFISGASDPLPIKVTEFLDRLPLPGRVRVVMAATPLMDLYSVHLASCPASEEERLKQVKGLLKFIDGHSGSIWPIILGGDFNFSKDNPACDLIRRSRFAGLATGPDMIFTRNCAITNHQVVFTDHYVSDHCGLLVEV